MTRLAPDRPESNFSTALLILTFLVGGFYFRILNRLHIEGRERIPRNGPVILVANHSSYLDPVLVGLALFGIRRIYYLAWRGLFRSKRGAAIIRQLGAIELDSETGVDRRAYTTARQILDEGSMVCVFPEGGRNGGKSLRVLKPGAARLALVTGAVILPARLDGPGMAWPRSRKLPRLFVPFRVTILPPIEVDAQAAGADARQAQNRIMERVREALESRNS